MPDFISLPIDKDSLPAGVVFNDFGYAELEKDAFVNAFLLDNFNRDGSAGQNFNFRHVIPNAQLSMIGSFLRVSMRAPAAARLDILDVYVGPKGAGNAWAFDGTQKKLQFSGLDGFSISNGETLVSDELEFPFDGTKDFVISFGYAASNGNPRINDLNAAGINTYGKANSAGLSGTTDPSGYGTTSDRLEQVFQIEVSSFPTTSPPAPTLPTDSGKTFDLADVFVYSGNFSVNTDIIVEQFRGGGVIRTLSLDTTPNAYGGYSLDALLSGTALPSPTTIDIAANDLFRFQLASDGTEERGCTGLFIEGAFGSGGGVIVGNWVL